MTGDDLAYTSIADLAADLKSKKISPVEVTELALERIERHDGALNSFITVMAETARAEAKAAERAIAAGDHLGPLHGVPVAAKDLYATKGTRTTFGSLLFSDWVPDHDAAAIERLKAAGAVLLGKTNLHELAYGTTSANPHFGPVHNPWKQGHHPGGSSGGSAAAVAAGLAWMALGSDTGASIRQPAACCGIVGIKPTFGRVSKHGCLPLAWSMDHAGPLNRSVRDAALTLNVLAGFDPRDPCSVDRPVPDFTGGLGDDLSGKRLAIVRTFFMEEGDPEVMAAVEATLPVLESLGAVIEEVELAHVEDAFKAGTMTIVTEGATYHTHHLRDRPDAFSPQCRADLELGHLYKATDYLHAQRMRRRLMTDVAEIMAPLDALIMPTAPITATPIEGNPADHPVYRVRNTIPFNFLGLPAISIPCGFSSEGMPIGLQIVGKAFDEAGILRIAHAYEEATDWDARASADDLRGRQRPVRLIAWMAVSSACRKRERSCFVNGRPPPLISPVSRSSVIRLRVASASPMPSSVNGRPSGAITRAPLATQRAASGMSAVIATSPTPTRSAIQSSATSRPSATVTSVIEGASGTRIHIFATTSTSMP